MLVQRCVVEVVTERRGFEINPPHKLSSSTKQDPATLDATALNNNADQAVLILLFDFVGIIVVSRQIAANALSSFAQAAVSVSHVV
jgi:hypothetical protein